jgi:uncharacterized membrane protein
MKVLIRRHIVKSISYRILGTITTIIIGYVLTGNVVIASSIGFIELCIKPLIYFLHERLWYKWIKFGLKKE